MIRDIGLRREKLPWFPTINYAVCTSDLECLNFCPYDVFAWDVNTGQPVVAHPYSCVPGCISCAQGCGAHAISFPSPEEVGALLRRFRREGPGARHAARDGRTA